MPKCKCEQCGLESNSKGASKHYKEFPHHAPENWLKRHPRYRNKAERLQAKEQEERESRPKVRARRHRVNRKEIREKVDVIKASKLDLDDYEQTFMGNMEKFANGTWSPRMTRKQLNYLEELVEAARMETSSNGA